MKKLISICLMLGLLCACSTTSISEVKNSQIDDKSLVEAPLIEARPSGEAIFTNDLDASVKFYTEYLGFTVYKRIVLDTPAALAPLGVSSDKSLDYVGLVPAGWTKERRDIPGLNFIQLNDSRKNPFEQDSNRTPINGEAIKAFSVKNLVEIERRMSSAGVPVVTSLAPSFTGRSMTLTVLDPNGRRLQLYEVFQ